MSENVGSSGFFAILKTPITDKAVLKEKREELYDSDSSIRVNHEGTLVYSDERSDGYGLTIGSKLDDKSSISFINDCLNQGLEIDEDSIRSYSCLWYNGSDSDMDILTHEEYLAKM